MGYAAVVAADNPVHWWRLADPGGAVALDIGSAAAKAPMLVSTFGSLAYTGMTSDGLCAVIPSTSEIRVASNIIAVPASPYSMECWTWSFFLDAAGDAIYDIGQVGGGARMGFRWNAAGKLEFNSNIGGNPVIAQAVASTQRAWHHLVITYDGVTSKLYVDGALAASVPAAPGGVFSAGAYLGETTGGTLRGNCFVEDVAWYTQALIPAQIANHFNAADQVASSPHWTGGGRFDTVLSTTTPLSTDVSSVLDAVRHTYQNAP